MSHDCIKRIDEQLAEKNTRIATAFSFADPERELIYVQTTKADSSVRGKPASLFATFCPFCGTKLKGGAA